MTMRRSGVLLHISSLPGPFGIGTMGRHAREFVDFLAVAGQSCWQLLPIGSTGFGDSPYQSFSSYAGNPNLIDLETLLEDGLLLPADLEGLAWGGDPSRVDYSLLYRQRLTVLRVAARRLDGESEDYNRFCGTNAEWLESYALFMSIKQAHGDGSWFHWPEALRRRDADAMAAAMERYGQDMELWRRIQYLFFRQWFALKAYANAREITIIGDLPIYVSADSADVWREPEQFQLDENLLPIEVAGCPPDGFSAQGQLWGNPLFDWARMEQDGFQWWQRRVAHQLTLFDTLRIDHFRGFEGYYAIPYGAQDARPGHWRKGPGTKLFQALEQSLGPDLPIIAEDLGFLTDSVRQLLTSSGFAGMKVLQFAFDSRDGESGYLPHNWPVHSVGYLGTHDNDTALGWYENLPRKDQEYAKNYLRLGEENPAWDMLRTMWSSVCELTVAQMQDLLALGSVARMNIPSTVGGNWCWRLTDGQLTPALAAQIQEQMRLYQRLPRPEKGDTAMDITHQLEALLPQGTYLADANEQEIYAAVLALVKSHGQAAPPPQEAQGRRLYYISAEFLVGKLLGSNLMSLGLYEPVAGALAAAGHDLATLEELEPEPSLGNGGLGRLAACFLDSIASLGLQGDGIGLNYHFGLFRQVFAQNKQTEYPDSWLTNNCWLTDTGRRFTVPLGGGSLEAVLYRLDVFGYQNDVVRSLWLFDVAEPGEAPEQGISFDKTDYAHQLTSFLYPDDSDDAGRLLRLYQQYFMVSAGAQLILDECNARGQSLRELDKYVVIQINDTHPSMIIPELIRLLMAQGIDFETASDLVRRTCAYTNHTILAEALEKWPLAYLEQAAPGLVPILKQLDAQVKARYEDPAVAIIDEENLVHMAHLDIHYSTATNGVASLHTEILKETELRPFYELYPEKFHNKTNGITLRRWLIGCNPELTDLINQLIGTDWQRDFDCLEDLLLSAEDPAVAKRMLAIKASNKQSLADYLQETQGITLNPESIFDVQIKRLHEYKRQQMNLFWAIWKYFEIKAGRIPARPITVIFGAKAAPAYVIAKDIIHAILCLQQLIAEDATVGQHLQVVMVENYNVTLAQRLIPAADISEQISLASKEASGTGNMKFMANGAITLGTLDGANVEIADLVGNDNVYLFGESSGAVIELYETKGYHVKDFYKTALAKPLVDFLIGPEMLARGDKECLKRLHKEISGKDWFMTLLDLEDYIQTKERMLADYEHRETWAKKMLINTARSGYFSADRTIRQYNDEIWHLGK